MAEGWILLLLLPVAV